MTPLTFYRTAPSVQPLPAEAAPRGHEPAERLRSAPRLKKAFTRRRGDRSQQIRLGVQLFFAAISIWVGAQFVLWVRYFESGGATLKVPRPDGVEAWLPIASLMNLKVLLVTHMVPGYHAAGMFMLIAFLAISFL